MSTRFVIPNRREHATQNVEIAGRCTLYISVHNHEEPAIRIEPPTCGLRNRFHDPAPAYSSSLRLIPAKVRAKSELWLE